MKYTAFGDNYETATWTGNPDDYFSSCRCCECQGKHCLMNHPGHSHHEYYGYEAENILVDEIRDVLDKMKRDGEPKQLDLLVILA